MSADAGFSNYITQPDMATVHAWCDNWVFYLNHSSAKDPDRPYDMAMSFAQMEHLAILWLQYRGFTVTGGART